MTRLEQVKAQIAGYAGESSEDRMRFAEQLAETLATEVDELRRRLDAVLAMLEPDEMPKRTFFDFHEKYMQDYRRWKLMGEIHARAVAIAEGRDNG